MRRNPKSENQLERVGEIVREPTARRQMSLLRKLEIHGYHKVRVKGGWQVVHQKDVPVSFGGVTTNPRKKHPIHRQRPKYSGLLMIGAAVGFIWLLSKRS